MKFVNFLLFIFPHFISSEPIALTDKNWKEMLCGQWMVEFYAPWCPSCQSFTTTWDKFSEEIIQKDVKVAAIDINQFPSLSGRFGIALLPTIYYVRDGVFRQFKGERSLNGLKNYIELQEWEKTEPVSSYLAPDSFLMSIVGSIFDVSLLVKDAYTVLQEKYGFPSWLIYVVLSISVIFIGLFLGFGVLMLIDYCLTGFSKDEPSYIPDDSRDAEDSDENEDEKSTNHKKSNQQNESKSNFVVSSTPQRTNSKKFLKNITPIQDEEELLDEVLQNDEEENENSSQSEREDRTDNDEKVFNQRNSKTGKNLRRRKKN